MNKPEKKDLDLSYNVQSFERFIGFNNSCTRWEECFDYLLSLIPGDDTLKKLPDENYARAYFQGQFDLLMKLRYEDTI